jgi:hypothetical protein
MRSIHRRGIVAGLAAARALAPTRARAWPDRAMRIGTAEIAKARRGVEIAGLKPE